MSDVRRQSRLTKAVECCFRKERGVDKPPLSKASPCDSCPYGNVGSTCRESMLDDLVRFLKGYDDKQQVEIGFDAYGDDVPICPQCDYQLRTGFAYCPKCGTAIDWGDFVSGTEYFEEDDVAYDDYSEESFA